MQEQELIGHHLRLFGGQRDAIQLQHQRHEQRGRDRSDENDLVTTAYGHKPRLKGIPEEVPANARAAHETGAFLVQANCSWFLKMIRPPFEGS